MRNLWIASAAVVLLSGSLMADTVSSTGTMTAFPTGFAATTPIWTGYATPPTANGNQGIFWNDASDDVGNGGAPGNHLMNIGYALTGTGAFSTSILTPVSDTITGATDLSASGVSVNFNFVRNALSYNIALIYANSGVNNVNGAMTSFGYYVGTTLTPIYGNISNTSTPLAAQAFNPGTSGTNYGFYETVCYSAGTSNCETFETGGADSGAYPASTAWNHFALFQLADGNYVIGFTGQNGMFGEGNGDYQDTVIELTQLAAPEPGTVAIMGLGLAALGLLGRRRFAKK